MEKDSKIYASRQRGVAGAAIVRELERCQGFSGDGAAGKTGFVKARIPGLFCDAELFLRVQIPLKQFLFCSIAGANNDFGDFEHE